MNNGMRGWIYLGSLMTVMVLAGCGQKGQPTIGVKEVQIPEIEVKTVKVVERDMPVFLRVIGELRSRVDSKVASDGSGKVMVAEVERGTVVKEGDLLVKLDDRAALLALREAKAQAAQARARLNLAEADWKRNEPLAKTKAIAEADFEKLSADLESAKADDAMALARLDTAEKNLRDLEIRAPFDGVVAERRVSAGEFVQAGAEVVQLVSAGNLRLLLQVPETAVGSMKAGQEVSFEVPAFVGQTFSGKVTHVGAVVRDATRDLLVEAEVPNADGRLKQGMFAEGRLALGTAKRLAVPLNAVKREGATTKVLRVEKDQIEECLVDLGEERDGWVEVRGGLSKDMMVVVDPGADAMDGAKVKVATLR
jgi:membrane fusion protein (multidrug efflux system)